MRLYFIISLLYFLSCGPPLPDQTELTRMKYEERKLSLLQEYDRECRQRAIHDAEVWVDSLVDQWINADLLDTISFPAKPSKPESPGRIIGKVQRFELDTGRVADQDVQG